jgi:hypothetical protein
MMNNIYIASDISTYRTYFFIEILYYDKYNKITLFTDLEDAINDLDDLDYSILEDSLDVDDIVKVIKKKPLKYVT